MFEKRSKKANILTENLLFIILNLVFVVILVLFIFSRMSVEGILEEKYAKQIALIIDGAKPVMEIHLNMKDAVEKAKSNNILPQEIVGISENSVNVKINSRGEGYSYSFFNDVDAVIYFDTTSSFTYIIKINGYKK